MEAKATLKMYRQSPRKVRLVGRELKGKTTDEARVLLGMAPKRVAPVLSKLIASAEANAKDKKIETDGLRIQSLRVDEGPTLFRMMPRAFGRATVIRKRTSHITVTLTPDGDDSSSAKEEEKTEGSKSQNASSGERSKSKTTTS